MIHLLLDIGNTRLKWSLWTEKNLTIPKATCFTASAWQENLYANWLELPNPATVMISSVAKDSIEQQVAAIISSLWGFAPIFQRPQHQMLGLTLAYKNPAKLGVDRWLAMLAARQLTTEAVLVVDCGTAVTIDAVNTQGQHLGGVIMPGLALLWQSIFHGTGITPVEFPYTVGILGQDTGECVAAGALQAVVGVIERLHAKLSSPDTPMLILLTGGDAVKVSEQLGISHRVIPELVLNGLALCIN